MTDDEEKAYHDRTLNLAYELTMVLGQTDEDIQALMQEARQIMHDGIAPDGMCNECLAFTRSGDMHHASCSVGALDQALSLRGRPKRGVAP